MIADLRFAFRQLCKSPSFAFVAILTLALGIGANTAIFSVINAALLRPLPYSEPEQLVEVWAQMKDGSHIPKISGPLYKQLRDGATSFRDIAISNKLNLNLIDRGKAERVSGLEVTASFCQALRLDPLHGSRFETGSDRVGGENHRVMLSYEWWQARFGGDSAIVGQVINLNQVSHTVIGVLPPRALAQEDASFLVPLAIDDAPWRTAPDNNWARSLGRLKPGVTAAQAQEEVRALATELDARLMPDRVHLFSFHVQPLQDVLTEDSRPMLLLLLGAVVLVLLVACANIANLLLARATTRQKEMALRSALGASAARIMRQMLTESLALALIGGMFGVIIAQFGVDLLGRAVVGVLPSVMQPAIDLRVLAFTLVVACGSGVLFGLFPALRARRADINHDLKEAGRGSTSGSRTRTQSLLIVSELTLTVILLIASGLLLRSFARVLGADPGFNPRNVLVADLTLSPSGSETRDGIVRFVREMLHQVEALPGVEAAGTATTLPLSGEIWGGRIGLSDRPPAEHLGTSAVDYVAGNYFRAMGISLIKGRLISESDNTADEPRVAVINERLGSELMQGRDPIGRSVHMFGKDWKVVGVVGIVRHMFLDKPGASGHRRVYLPEFYSPNAVRIIVRTRVAPMSIAEDLRRTIATFGPNQSISNLRTLEQAVGRSLQERRVALVLLAFFATVALGLACVGVYGVTAYTIGQRERELSIRMALGAEQSDVIRLVLRDGLRLGLIGVAAGLAGGIACSQLIASRLYEVSALDPLVFALAGIVIALVTTFSVYFAARRAARIDTLLALRAE